MEEQKQLSLRLYEVLETVGASEKMRKLHRRTATTREILQSCLPAIFNLYICGSSYEGSVTPALVSDQDVIVGHNLMPVVFDVHAAQPSIYSHLIVSDEWTYPGYVKLQLMVFGLPITGNIVGSFRDVHIRPDEVGRSCFQNTSSMMGITGTCPAVKTFDKNGVHIVDYIMAWKCKTLPEFARERLEVLRRRRFITEEELDDLIGMGCMVVCAGHFLSSERDIEYRLSFSLQERHFMSKLNPTQHKVYILLKLIKRNIIENLFGSEILTSYHLKTCVLYAVEMTSVHSWTPDNLITCLTQCIKLLIMWLKANNCPNYFNVNQNLFSKKGFSRCRMQLLQVMERLLHSNNNFLTLIKTDHVGDILIGGEMRFKNEIDTKKKKISNMFKLFVIGDIVHAFSFVLNRLCGGHYSTDSLITALKSLQQTETLPGHTAAETRRALRYLQPWLHLHIAKSLAASSYSCRDRSVGKQKMKEADVHFHKAERTDLVNVALAKASILYKSEQYDTCYGLLQQIQNDFTYKVTAWCPLSARNSFELIKMKFDTEHLKTLSGMSVRNIMKQFFANSVIFLPSEYHSVPAPLQYEMLRSIGTQPGSRFDLVHFWFDWCAIDADVYLYFMLYLVCSKIGKQAHKQVAMDNLRAVTEEANRRVMIEGNKSLPHRDTACNILGWIYMQEQRYGDATQCFLRSWEIRRFHNAAKFHMRDLVAKLSVIDRQESDHGSE